MMVVAVIAITIITCFEIARNKPVIQPIQNIHSVLCIDEYGDAQQYLINIPTEVQNVEAFSKGFCDSL